METRRTMSDAVIARMVAMTASQVNGQLPAGVQPRCDEQRLKSDGRLMILPIADDRRGDPL